MKDIRQLHRDAMLLAKEASSSLAEGDSFTYFELAAQAFTKEREAALELISSFESEPTRSVLFRSAASIAFNIGDYSEAQKLIHLALAGSPYEEIKTELQLLLEDTQRALATNATKVVGLENAYIEQLRETAVNIKLEPTDNRYSKAIVIDYITEFLRNIQICFSNFSEVNFKKLFQLHDFPDFNKTLNLFKKDTKALCVGLQFKSFGVSVAVDTSLQNYRDITSPKFKKFKNTLFEDFKEEILLADFNNTRYQEKISTKYSEQERNYIFTSVIESLKEKGKYRISIVDKNFKNTIKTVPVINKKAIAILKPIIEKSSLFDDGEKLIRRTFELTNSAGVKGEKILSENLEYAEFKIILDNIKSDGKEAYFINPYGQKVIFNRGTFIIEDEMYNIYVEGDDFKGIESVFANELISKFSTLLKLEEDFVLKKEDMSLDDKRMLEIFKTTIIKGW